MAFRRDNYAGVTRAKTRSHETAQRIQEEKVGLIELDEVVRLAHIATAHAWGELYRSEVFGTGSKNLSY
jgi:hypothetical protein